MRIEKIIVHCTDAPGGTAASIRDFHIHQRGWADIGYHYVITNGNPGSGRPEEAADGVLWPGRSPLVAGAHAQGHNLNSLGVALVGTTAFTDAQIRRQSIVEFRQDGCAEDIRQVWSVVRDALEKSGPGR
ncbi:MAG: N-acetylmuramoyl-L-alanine amidase [Planctomycetota bacterium]